MKHAKLRDLDVSPHRAGRDGHVRRATREPAATTPSPSAPFTGPSTWVSRSSTPPRSTGPTRTRSSSVRPCKGRRDEVVLATKFGMISHTGGGPGTSTAARPTSAPRVRRFAAAPRHRPHRPVLPAPGRPEHAHRGHRRRARRARRRGQDPPHRPVGGRRRHDPARPRRAPDHRPAVRILAVDPRSRSPRCCPLLRELGIGFVPYSPLGHGLPHRPRSARPTTSTPTTARKTNPRFMGENFERNLRIADEVEADRRRGRRHPGAGRPGLVAGQGRRHRPDPRHQARLAGRGERRRRRRRADRRSDAPSWTTSPRPPAITTTRRRCR